MSDELNHAQSNPDTSFEREDLSTRGVFVFMIGLAITGIVIYFIIRGMYGFLDNYEHAQMSTASPLAPGADASSRYIVHDPAQGDYVTNKFKENGAPMLESDERGQFKNFLLNQEDQLNSYGWVDQQDGVAHIPIERAMDLIVERGLPVLPAHQTEANAVAVKAPTANKAAAKK
ncbi:MAG: hypothetical protein WAL71_18430 [Terriglobales bacterium]|jgi:hypothetical protein